MVKIVILLKRGECVFFFRALMDLLGDPEELLLFFCLHVFEDKDEVRS